MIHKTSLKVFLLFTSFLGFLCGACGGADGEQEISLQQASGILTNISFETIACQPVEKKILIRNTNEKDPQRIQWIQFEPGTNEDNYFQITKVVVGDEVYETKSNVIEEVIVPAGSLVTIHTTYNPRTVTNKKTPFHTTYISMKPNLPALGIIQFKLIGKADQAAPGCVANPGGVTKTLKVLNGKYEVRYIDENMAPQTITDTLQSIKGPFEFTVDGEKVRLTEKGFPKFNISAQGNTIPVELKPGNYDGTFKNGELEISGVAINAGGPLIPFTDLKITTGTSEVTGKNGQSKISLTGSPLQSGKMTIVIVAAFPQVDLLKTLNGGVIGITLELSE